MRRNENTILSILLRMPNYQLNVVITQSKLIKLTGNLIFQLSPPHCNNNNNNRKMFTKRFSLFLLFCLVIKWKSLPRCSCSTFANHQFSSIFMAFRIETSVIGREPKVLIPLPLLGYSKSTTKWIYFYRFCTTYWMNGWIIQWILWIKWMFYCQLHGNWIENLSEK